ncbi:MAG: ATP-binding protein [Desulfobacterales bacterium]
MDISKETPAGRTLLAIVYAVVTLLLGAGILLGVWTAQEMNEVVTGQFNAQQMTIARTARDRVERELAGMRGELELLARSLASAAFDPAGVQDRLHLLLDHLGPLGLRRIDLIETASGQGLGFTTAGIEHVRSAPGEVPQGPAPEESRVWTSAVFYGPEGRLMRLAVHPAGRGDQRVEFRLDIGSLLTSILGPIRSGKSGYAWAIDAEGRFLFHPNPEFSGRDAFSVRDERFPGLSHGRIHFIQREEMLRGEEGTGEYDSGWHHGYVGPTKKLIAYCPVRVSENPPRLWSVAVVAPQEEVEEALRRGSIQLLLLQGLVVLAVILGAAALLWLESRWARILEARVVAKTDALAKSEEKYRSLVESAEDFIFAVDREGRFQSLNTFTAKFFGGSPAQFVGRPLSAVLPGPLAQHLAGRIAEVHRSGKSLREEFEFPLEDRPCWFSAHFLPLRSGSPEGSSILCIARDITETKELQRQLVNTEKLASLGTLAAGVAHEINNPLGVILGFCELLLRKAPPGSQLEEDLKTIERQGLICKETVENLLSFARAEKEPGEHADLNACIESITKIVRPLLDKKGVALVLALEPGLPPVHADARQLQQVFLNLINNAIAAMPDGGTLTLRSWHERPPRRVAAQVQDTGIGIPPEHLDRIFEPFFTTKPEGQGTGLGLFVSYGIVTGYGGTLECTSTPVGALGKRPGTTFTMRLPQAEPPGAGEPQPLRPEEEDAR